MYRLKEIQTPCKPIDLLPSLLPSFFPFFLSVPSFNVGLDSLLNTHHTTYSSTYKYTLYLCMYLCLSIYSYMYIRSVVTVHSVWLSFLYNNKHYYITPSRLFLFPLFHCMYGVYVYVCMYRLAKVMYS